MLPPWAQRIKTLLDADPAKSAAGLARACGIKGGSVSGWFGAGKPTKMISGDNLVSAAAYLGTTAEYIMTGREHVAASQSQAVSMDTEMLKSAIVSVKEALRTLGLELDAFLAAPLIAYAYAERIAMPRVMSKDEYAAFDAMVTAKLQGELGNVGKQGRVVEEGGGGTKAAATHKTKVGARK
ncbi:MAG TPA: hypothetical protein VN612_04320 [Acidobacteriaceae bacterium]|nr:hypothetical protein [Acidobacteriaceae bacterium]